MLKKTTIYGLGVAAFVALVGFSRWSETKFLGDSLRAGVATEAELSVSSVEFLTDYDEATRIADRENKPVLLFFMSKNCRYSRAMLDGAFSDERIARLSEKFVCVQIDINGSEGERICDELKVSASPTIQFTTSRGVPLQRLTQNQPVENLANQMQAALTSVAWRESQTEERATFFR